MSAGGPRRGRRDNGLDAAEYAVAGDVDPRVGEHLLDVLAAGGIAAYLQPASDLNPVTRTTTIPARPTDRLYVDRAHLATAREYLARLAADERSAAADGPPGRNSTNDPDIDAEWARIVAGFDTEVDPRSRPWPAAENLEGPGERRRRRATDPPAGPPGGLFGRSDGTGGTLGATGRPADPAAGMPGDVGAAGPPDADGTARPRDAGGTAATDPTAGRTDAGPGGATTEPGGATTEPGGATAEPGGATAEPGGATTEPGGAPTEPGVTTGGTGRPDTDRPRNRPTDPGGWFTDRPTGARGGWPPRRAGDAPGGPDTPGGPDGPSGPEGPGGAEPRPEGAEPAGGWRIERRSGPRSTGPDEPSLLDALDRFGADLPDDPSDDEGYTPPPPPPLPRLSKYTVAAVLAVFGGFVLFLFPGLLQPLDADVVRLAGFTGILAGFVTLIWRMRPGDEEDLDDDPDNGAVV